MNNLSKNQMMVSDGHGAEEKIRRGHARLHHHISEQNVAITIQRETLQERYFSLRRDTSSDGTALLNSFPPKSGNVIAQMVFGGCSFHESALASMGGADWPLLWIQGDVCPGTYVSGVQAFTLVGQPVRRVLLNKRIVGCHWSDTDADYCLLAGILPANLGASRSAQTHSSFEQIEAALQQVDMTFSHVVRTWFFLDKLHAWYADFNIARTEFFQSRGVFKRLIPASTGIGGGNPAGAAVAAGALAIRPRHSRVHIQEVCSPLQCPATEYRSSFSRAVEATFPNHRMLIISGTASIAPDGKTEYVGNVIKQIHLTLDVVEAILKSREMDWKNTTRAIGYFRNIADLPIFDTCCRERGIPPLPMIPAHATVCREDLLFEIELDAIVI